MRVKRVKGSGGFFSFPSVVKTCNFPAFILLEKKMPFLISDLKDIHIFFVAALAYADKWGLINQASKEK